LLEEAAIDEASEATRAHLAECEACRRHVEKLRAGARAFAEQDAAPFLQMVARGAEGERRARGLALTRIAWLAAPLAAAAIFVLLARPAAGPLLEPAAQTARFKGGEPAVFAIVEHGRGAEQERVTGEVRVRAGDRVRVEVSVDHPSPIVAGVLEDDGAWTQLLAPAELDAGTHFSDLAARFDDPVRPARILVGAPEAVARGRTGGDLAGVVVLRILPAP
jgi:hypothetical protein